MDNEIRLQKFLAESGVASRRKSEELIAEGKVKVNNKVATVGQKINPKVDMVTVGDDIIEPEKKVYYLLNKPKGYVCTNEDKYADRTIFDLLPQEKKLHSVGRLDKDSEGLIIVTNDGELTQILTHPSHQVDKTYKVILSGRITPKAMDRLRKGVQIEVDNKTFKTSPAEVELIGYGNRTSVLEITIHEGKKRQIRLMCKEVGYPVVSLTRLREDFLTIEGIKPGKYRRLTRTEVARLKK